MRRNKTHRKVLTALILIAIILGLGIGVYSFDYVYRQYRKIIKEVTVESGSPVSLDMFFTEVLPDSYFITDISRIDTSVPASYQLYIGVWKFSTTVVLHVVDTTPPTGEAISQIIFAGELPPVEDCVKSVTDLAPVTFDYADENPDVSQGGQYNVPVRLTDMYGNSSILEVPFLVIDDHTAPEIHGVQDMEYWLGDPIHYRDGIVVTDDYDPTPSFSIDNSSVRPDAPGEYEIVYTASDDAGNVNTLTATLTLAQKPIDYEDMLLVNEYAQEILDSITTPDMTDIEKAFRIFYWTRYNIHYIGTSDKTTWAICALEGFTTLRGDCYTYFACSKALLDVAGIENVMVERYPVYSSHHYWNLVLLDGQWYHCDSTPFESRDGFIFMYIDSELGRGNTFDHEREDYPERATESVQHRLNYYTMEYEEE